MDMDRNLIAAIDCGRKQCAIMSSTAATHVKWLFSSGEEGFVAPEHWCEKLGRAGIRCAHCGAIRADAIENISEVMVEWIVPKRVVSSVSSLRGGQILRCDLIDVIGRQKLEQFGFFVPVVDETGDEGKDIEFFIEKVPRGIFRGTEVCTIGTTKPRPNIEVCKECGRLMYWPMGKWYLLRRYWDGSDGVTVMDNELLCTPEYFRDVLGPCHFPKLKGETRALADEPQDGLPADYDEMVAAVKQRGWMK